MKVFNCTHPGHADAPHVDVRDCLRCPDFAPPYGAWPDPGHPLEPPSAGMCLACALRRLDLPPDTGGATAKEWSGWPAVIDAHRIGLASAAHRDPPPAPPLSGRGIVIGAGGVGYFTQGYVCASVLRALNCKLPIQFWHLGPGEMDDRMRALVAPLGVECVDARAVAATLPTPPRILNGWEMKPFAMLHSPFAEVLYLDADNVPVYDPEQHFDDPAYRDKGALFWPDLPPGDRPEWIPRGAWEACGLRHRPEVRAFESGQVLVDKRRCWRELSLTVWMAEHSDRFFQILYGDKDLFCVAWWKAAGVRGEADQPYAMPAAGAGWNGVAIVQHDTRGGVAFLHRCQNKWSLHRRPRRVRRFAHINTCLDALWKIGSLWRGRVWDWADMPPGAAALAPALAGAYRYERVGLGERRLELLPRGEVGVGAADCERWWSVRLAGGVPELVISGSRGGTMFLREAAPGRWEGRWEYGERCPVILEAL